MRHAQVLSKPLLGLPSRQQYWDQRYESEGALWGWEREIFDQYIRIFTNEKAKKILILGCGYGRSVVSFGDRGFDVIGLDFSRKAMQLERKSTGNRKSEQAILASVCDVPLKEDCFDGILAYNIMHLLLDDERSSFIQEIKRVIRENGIVIIVAFSFLDKDYGKGIEVETDTFYDEIGKKTTHFFSEDEILEYLNGYKIVETSNIKIQEQHGGKHHIHNAIKVVARKLRKPRGKQLNRKLRNSQ